MPNVPRDSITSVRVSLRVDGEPHLLIALDAHGHVKRMGYSSLSAREPLVAAGHADGLFQAFMDTVPPGLLDRAGVYTDPGTDGSRCHWRLDFDGEQGPARFELTYCAGSAGLPAAIAKLVEKAEGLTESWYDEHLMMAGAGRAASQPAQARIDAPVAPPAAARRPNDVAQTGSIGNYLSFRGRIGRIDYILQYGLPLVAISFAGSFADGFVGLASGDQIGPMGMAAALLTLWPSLAGWAKRLHDLDFSFRLVVGSFVGAGVLMGVTFALSPGLGLAAGALFALGMIGVTLATYFAPGTTGPNQYGPDPAAARG